MHRNKIVPPFLSLAALLSTLAVHSEETAVVTEGKINVRGKPAFVGEVITQLERGDKVTVLERITVDKPKTNEPANWAKIKLPDNTPVWVFAPFVKDGKVAATRLNLRAGPSENHDVIGRLNRGDEVNAIRTVEEWMEIQAPKDAYAFIDISLIKFDGDTNAPASPTTVAAVPQPEKTEPKNEPKTEPQPAPVVTSPPVSTPGPTVPAVPAATPAETATAPTQEKPAIEPAPIIILPPGNAAPAAASPSPETSRPSEPATEPVTEPRIPPQTTPPQLPAVAQPLPPKRDEPLPKRVVRREGVIRATRSIQAPTWYELANGDTGKTINYLYDQKFSANSGIKLKDYRGKKVVVSGEEAIDSRWPNTPIIDIETLDLLP